MAINYNATTWVDDETPVNEDNMNNIEQGISAAYSQININTNAITQNSNDISEIQNKIGGDTGDSLAQESSVQKVLNRMSYFGTPTDLSNKTNYNKDNENIVTQTTSATTTYTIIDLTGSGELDNCLINTIMTPYAMESSPTTGTSGNKTIEINLTVDGVSHKFSLTCSGSYAGTGYLGFITPLLQTAVGDGADTYLYYALKDKLKRFQITSYIVSSFYLYLESIPQNLQLTGSIGQYGGSNSLKIPIFCPNRISFSQSLKVEITVTPWDSQNIAPVYVDYSYWLNN